MDSTQLMNGENLYQTAEENGSQIREIIVQPKIVDKFTGYASDEEADVYQKEENFALIYKEQKKTALFGDSLRLRKEAPTRYQDILNLFKEARGLGCFSLNDLYIYYGVDVSSSPPQ